MYTYFIFLYRWCRLKKVIDCHPVPIPPLLGDTLRNSTVLPYLQNYHYHLSQDNLTNIYFTEHEYNGKHNGTCIRLLSLKIQMPF